MSPSLPSPEGSSPSSSPRRVSFLPSAVSRCLPPLQPPSDLPDLPEPRLPLFSPTSHLSPRVQSQPRRPRSSHPRRSFVVRPAKTPRTMRVQPVDLFSPFNVPDSIPYLSLLPPRSPESDAAQHAMAAASPLAPPAPPSVPFLSPLLHLSSEGLTLHPPTLNWSTASRVLDTATSASYDLVASSTLCEVDRERAVDRLVALHLHLDVESLTAWSGQRAAQHWRDNSQADYDAVQRQHLTDRIDALASVDRQRRQMAALHRDTAATLTRAFHFLHIDEQDDRRRRHARLTRQHVHTAALHRIEAHEHNEAARWSLAWHQAAAVHAAQREREMIERAVRAQADALKAEEEWNEARARAKQGRVDLRVLRLELTDLSIVPPNTVPFFACQVVSVPSAKSLDNPTPLSELHFSPFASLVEEVVEGDDDGDGEGTSLLTTTMEWRCQMSVKSVASTQLLLSLQCADAQQAERWIRTKAKVDAKREEKQRANASAKPSPVSKKGKTPAAKASSEKKAKKKSSVRPVTSSSVSTSFSSSSAFALSNRSAAGSVSRKAGKKKKKGKEWSKWSHPQRHRVVTRTVELGRLEWRVKQLRESPGGEIHVKAELQAECWYAKRERAERKRRKSTVKEGDESAEAEAASSGLSPRPPSAASKSSLHPALTLIPSSLFPPPYQPHHSPLQLVLMTDKERQSWLEEEERRERLRREREEKEKAKWMRPIGHVWLEIRLRPMDSEGAEIVKPGTREEDEQSDKEDEGDEERGDEDEAEEVEWSDDETGEGEVDVVEIKEEPPRRVSALPGMRQVVPRAKEVRGGGVEAQAVRGVTFPILE